MGNKKDLTYHNLSSIEEMVEQLVKHKKEILENFSKAYLAEKEVLPSEVELVEQFIKEDGKMKEVVYFFRIKEKKK